MADPARHDERVQREFTRQAESFAASSTLGGADLVDRLVGALGDAARGRVLDLAAGPGLVTRALSPLARQVVALDLTAETLRVAQRDAGANVRLVRGNGLRLPLAEGHFDAVVVRLALHHLERPAAALAQAHGALRAGGRLGVLDLLAPEDPERERVSTALEQLRDPSHVRALRESELAESVADAGFEVVEAQVFTLERRFSEWAAIIADPVRTDALRVVMRELCRRGEDAGVNLREDGEELLFDYRFGLVVGRRP